VHTRLVKTKIQKLLFLCFIIFICIQYINFFKEISENSFIDKICTYLKKILLIIIKTFVHSKIISMHTSGNTSLANKQKLNLNFYFKFI